jgi:hypothetical protein
MGELRCEADEDSTCMSRATALSATAVRTGRIISSMAFFSRALSRLNRRRIHRGICRRFRVVNKSCTPCG